MRKGDERRANILRVAEELFYAKGYDATTVQDILDVLRLSKGGFYHHYESKDQLLEEICSVKVRAAAEAGRAEAEYGASAVDKLNTMLDRSCVWRGEYADFLCLLMRIAYRDDNILMHAMFERMVAESVLPAIEGILIEGTEAGEFAAQDPRGGARLVVRLLGALNDDIAHLMIASEDAPPAASEILTLLELYRKAIERMLEAPYGSIVIFQMGRMATSCQAIWQRNARVLRTALPTPPQMPRAEE